MGWLSTIIGRKQLNLEASILGLTLTLRRLQHIFAHCRYGNVYAHRFQFTVYPDLFMMEAMSILSEIRWRLIGALGRMILWVWAKSTRMIVIGHEAYSELRADKRPVILLVWHGRIFLVPFFFRKRKIMPLVSPSEDGEIVARIMSGWDYKILRGSGSHVIAKAWSEMVKELLQGGEVIIVPDGPKGPNRKMKLGALKLAQQTGAYLMPFSFSTSKKKFLRSWDSFLMFYPFRRVVAVYGEPIAVSPDLNQDELEEERERIQNVLIDLDNKADQYFEA